MIKRILVGLAGTTDTPVAIERAITLARTHDAEVTRVTVLDMRRVRSGAASAGDATTPDRRIAITQERITQSIRDFEAACQTASIKHRVVADSAASCAVRFTIEVLVCCSNLKGERPCPRPFS